MNKYEEWWNKANKYKNKPVVIDGIRFDSQKEGIRYKELKLLERAGLIKDIKLQTTFELQPSFDKNGNKFRAITYRADFDYITKDGKHIIEDVKSHITKTEVYKIKKKMFEYKYPELTIKEIE